MTATTSDSTLFVVNGFTDLNYISPLVLEASRQGLSLNVVIFFEDLKRPNKVLFQDRRLEILSWPMWKSHNVMVAESLAAFRRTIRAEAGTIISTTPTLLSILRRRRVAPRTWRTQPRLVGLDYLGEETGKIIEELDSVFLSSPVFNNGYPEHKVRYGLPYWDIFGWHDTHVHEYERMQQSTSEQLPVASAQRNVLIPQIVTDEDQWFEDCLHFLETKANPSDQYIIKYRPKTPDDQSRTAEVEQRLNSYGNVKAVYSPYFFSLSLLLKNCSNVVFTSNGSFIIFDCMAAGAEVHRAYQTPKSGIWQEWLDQRVTGAVDEYAANPERAQANYISNQGVASQLLLKEMHDEISAPV